MLGSIVGGILKKTLDKGARFGINCTVQANHPDESTWEALLDRASRHELEDADLAWRPW